MGDYSEAFPAPARPNNNIDLSCRRN